MTVRPLPVISAKGLEPSPLKGALTPLRAPLKGRPLAVLRDFYVDDTDAAIENSNLHMYISGADGSNSIDFLGAEVMKDIAWPVLHATQEPVFKRVIERRLVAFKKARVSDKKDESGSDAWPDHHYTVQETEIGALIVTHDISDLVEVIGNRRWQMLPNMISFLWREPTSSHARLAQLPDLDGIAGLANQTLDIMGIPASALRFRAPDIA